MIFTETKLKGAFLIEPKKFEDARGFFATSWSAREFESHGISPRLVDCNISYNVSKGTLRGMHFQREPHPQAKLVRCTRGRIYDVAIDLRPDSPTFRQWAGAELTAENHLMLFIPEGFAHGFLTLEDDTEVFYQVSEVYSPECADGVRWNDPAFGVEWPGEVRVIIERDRDYPDFTA